jgi:hypothetical protein
MNQEERGEPRAPTIAPSSADQAASFTAREWMALLLLRRRYLIGHDLWDARELERLRFMRWLLETGRVES